jgi:replication-associated recombination protein RarA
MGSPFETYSPKKPGHKNPKDVKVRGVLIWGPQGCGKTKNADILLEHFGKKRVMEEWENHDVPADSIALACENAKDIPGAISFWEALRLVCDRKIAQQSKA